MKDTKRLSLDDLHVDSFATLDRALAVRGTVHANADVISAAAGCMTVEVSMERCMETWGFCPSEYRTACESETDQYTCTVQTETQPGPA